MKVKVDIELLEKATCYLTLYGILHEGIKNEEFKSMLDQLELITDRPECTGCKSRDNVEYITAQSVNWCWKCENEVKTE